MKGKDIDDIDTIFSNEEERRMPSEVDSLLIEVKDE